MSENRDRNLEALSRIDEGIVEWSGKKRATLKSKPHKSSKKKWYIMGGAMAAAAALVLGVILLLVSLLSGQTPDPVDPPAPGPVGNKQVPVYQGMTVSNTLVSDAAAQFDGNGSNGNGNNENNGNHYGQYKGDYKQDQVLPEGEPFPDKPLSGSLTVLGGDDGYYAKPGEYIYITVHLSNPDKFEILSFTLNGEKYSSYMFEDGSDLEKLILKVNVGQVEGMVSYTIDAIKYVDGEEIKDVRMDGDQTVEVGVYTEKQPTATVNAMTAGFNSVSFTVGGTDEMNLIAASNGKLEAVLYNGIEIVERKTIALAESTVTFEDLAPNTLYQYAIVASYDALDGKGFSEYILTEQAFYTEAPVLFDSVSLSTTGVVFALDWHESADGAVQSIVLSDGTSIRELDTAATAIDDLLPATDYTLTVTYKNGDRTETITLEFATAPLTYTVNHLMEQFDGSFEVMESVTDVIAFGTTVTPEVQIHEGFTSPAEMTITGQTGTVLEVNYYYERTAYTLTFVRNDGSEPDTLSLKYGYEIPGDPREGFGGWFRDADLTEAVTTVPAESLTLYAKWENVTSAELLTYTGLETLTVTGLKEGVTLSELSIPSYIGGKRVTEIASNAFMGKSFLVRVVVPNSVTAIGTSAFQNCNGLTTLSLPFAGASPEGTQGAHIGYIFGAATSTDNNHYVPNSLKTVEITGAVDIASNAFAGCVWLEDVTLGSAVTSIGEGAFTGCSGLRSITLPFVGDRLKNPTDNNQYTFGYIFGRNAFEGATATEQTYHNTYNAETKGWTLSAVEDSTYYIPDSLTSVTVTGGYIPYKAFYKCEHLTDLAVSGNVLNLGMANCSALERVTLHPGVTSLGHSAFVGCTSLTTLHIPSYVTAFDANALDVHMNSITLDAGHPVFYLQDNCLINRETKTLVRAFSGFILPTDGSVEIIGARAFCKRTELTEFTVPAFIKGVGSHAFASCANLTAVHFAAGSPVTAIEFGTFVGCTSLSHVTLPTGITVIEENAFLSCTELSEIVLHAATEAIGYEAFRDCTALSTVTIPADSSLTSIGSGAFQGSGLTAISLPESLSTLSPRVFQDCTALESVAFHADSQLTTIHSLTFGGCTSLTAVNIPASVELINGNAFKNCTALTDLSIAAGVKQINGNAFLGCSGLQTLVLPDTLTFIGINAFAGCAGLVEITIPFVGNKSDETAETDWQHPLGCIFGETEYEGGVATSQSFYGNKNAETGELTLTTKTYYIPAGLTKVTVTGGNILRGAFQNCATIQELTLPQDLTIVSEYAFIYCTALTKMTLPTGVKSIGKSAFNHCQALAEITLSEELESIGETAFYECKALSKIAIPKSVTSIDKDAFNWCTNLKEVYISDIAAWCGVEFGEGYSNPIRQSTTLYLNDTLVTDLTIPDTVTEIKAYAFWNCDSIEKVTLPASITKIGASVFNACNNIKGLYISDLAAWCNINFSSAQSNPLRYNGGKLYVNDVLVTDLEIPDTVTQIKDYAFHYCNCKTVSIPASVTRIGISAFDCCAALEIVTFEKDCQLTKIAASAFKNCSKLTTITIPAKVAEIGKSAFENCGELLLINIPASVKTIDMNAFAGCARLAVAKFEVTENWKLYDGTNSMPIPVIVSDSSSAANYLKDTYSGKKWKNG